MIVKSAWNVFSRKTLRLVTLEQRASRLGGSIGGVLLTTAELFITRNRSHVDHTLRMVCRVCAGATPPCDISLRVTSNAKRCRIAIATEKRSPRDGSKRPRRKRGNSLCIYRFVLPSPLRTYVAEKKYNTIFFFTSTLQSATFLQP